MDFSSAAKSLFPSLSVLPAKFATVSSASDEDSSLHDDKSRNMMTTEARMRVVSPEKSGREEEEEDIKPCILEQEDEFFDCQEDDGSIEFVGTKRLVEDERVWFQQGDDSGNLSSKHILKKGVFEFMYWDEPTGEYVGWWDGSIAQDTAHSGVSYSDHVSNHSNLLQKDPEDDLLNNTSSHSMDSDGDVSSPNSEGDEDQEDESNASTASKSDLEDEEGNSVGCVENEILLCDDDSADEYSNDANETCLEPGQFNIEEWHGCRIDHDGEKQFLIKWEGFPKTQWMQGDFFFSKGNATAAAVEELQDKCKRFPPCRSCVLNTPHICWEIENYIECSGIYGRKVVDGIVHYKIQWSSNQQDAWVVAGQFNEPSWEKVQKMHKRIKCIDCNRGDENHVCLGNAVVVSPRLKAAITFKPKPRRRQLPTHAQSSSSRARSVPSKRKRSSQALNAKAKKRKTSVPRKAVEPPRNPAPFLAGGSPLLLGNQVVKEIQFQSNAALREWDCLAACIFEDRLRYSSWDERRRFPATRELSEMGEMWQLLYPIQPTRQKKAYVQQKFTPQKRGAIKVCYVAVRVRHEDSTVDLQHELEKLGDFSMLSPEKVVARIKLLFTDPVKTGYTAQPRCIFSTPTTIYSEIEERGNDGCGFFSRELITQLFDDEKLRQKYKKAAAIMVRIVCPKLGIFKGVLVLKDDPVNLVELPPSMRKVLPSKHDDWKGKAALLVKLTFPSNPNIALEKYWRTGKMTKAATTEREEGLSNGIVRFLRKALKVKDGELLNICADAKKLASNRHANVVGVADCTNAIPAGTVYLSGFRYIPNFRAALEQKSVFVCRHPCTERADARKLTILTDRPSGMSQAQWEFLERMPFGLIMFGFTVGRCAIPPQISNGDLDGDLYFVSWDRRLIDLDLIPVSTDACGDEPDTNQQMPNPNWLESANELMTDVVNSEKYGKLMSVFHGLWETSNNELDEADYGHAYKMSLDIQKHGGKITVPRYSWDKVIPRTLHSFLQQPECPELTEVLHQLYSRAVNELQRSELLDAYKESLMIEASGGSITLSKRWWAQIPEHLHLWICNDSRQTDRSNDFFV